MGDLHRGEYVTTYEGHYLGNGVEHTVLGQLGLIWKKVRKGGMAALVWFCPWSAMFPGLRANAKAWIHI